MQELLEVGIIDEKVLPILKEFTGNSAQPSAVPSDPMEEDSDDFISNAPLNLPVFRPNESSKQGRGVFDAPGGELSSDESDSSENETPIFLPDDDTILVPEVRPTSDNEAEASDEEEDAVEDEEEAAVEDEEEASDSEDKDNEGVVSRDVAGSESVRSSSVESDTSLEVSFSRPESSENELDTSSRRRARRKDFQKDERSLWLNRPRNGSRLNILFSISLVSSPTRWRTWISIRRSTCRDTSSSRNPSSISSSSRGCGTRQGGASLFLKRPLSNSSDSLVGGARRDRSRLRVRPSGTS